MVIVMPAILNGMGKANQKLGCSRATVLGVGGLSLIISRNMETFVFENIQKREGLFSLMKISSQYSIIKV